MPPKTVIILTGPTASGKTDLAMELARSYKTSIISADSRQCFRELNIGVAKPPEYALQEIPHYFVNSHSIEDSVNAAVFETLATKWCEIIFQRNDLLIISGGTGLYIKAFLEGLDEIPAVNERIRQEIVSHYRVHGLTWLQEIVQVEDPLFFSSGEIANPQRMMRALEVIRSTGRSIISYRKQQKKQNTYRILEFALSLPRKELYHRINERVDRMMESGLMDEVKSLHRFRHLNALQTVGYTELFDFLDGKTDLNTSISLIKQNTRHYAKRQMTWMNKNKNLTWLEGNGFSKISAAFEDY